HPKEYNPTTPAPSLSFVISFSRLINLEERFGGRKEVRLAGRAGNGQGFFRGRGREGELAIFRIGGGEGVDDLGLAEIGELACFLGKPDGLRSVPERLVRVRCQKPRQTRHGFRRIWF